MGIFSNRAPQNLGVHAGQLAACPDSPNCVSSYGDGECQVDPLPLPADIQNAEAAADWLESLAGKLPRTRLISRNENYLHFECRSAVFRFVDDLEFLIDWDQRVAHVRSASRVGYSDLGANRQRVERLRSLMSESATPAD